MTENNTNLVKTNVSEFLKYFRKYMDSLIFLLYTIVFVYLKHKANCVTAIDTALYKINSK